jgi:hypothetical protein
VDRLQEPTSGQGGKRCSGRELNHAVALSYRASCKIKRPEMRKGYKAIQDRRKDMGRVREGKGRGIISDITAKPSQKSGPRIYACVMSQAGSNLRLCSNRPYMWLGLVMN